MLLYIFLPLLISWLFKRFKLKRIYFTYLVSGGIILLIPILVFVVGFLSMDTPDIAAFSVDKGLLVSVFGNIGFALFFTLFFQYIFNKTMGLKRI